MDLEIKWAVFYIAYDDHLGERRIFVQAPFESWIEANEHCKLHKQDGQQSWVTSIPVPKDFQP